MRLAHLALALALAGVPAVLADEIHHLGGARDQYLNVEIIRINFKTVWYMFLDEKMRGAGEQQEEMKKVERIVFTIRPPEYETAEGYYEQGNIPAAAAAFRRSMSDRSRNGWVDQYALFYIAKCQEALGDQAKAAEAYQELLTKFADTVHIAEANLSLSEIQLASGKSKDAKRTLEALAQVVRKEGLNRAWGLKANLYLRRLSEAEGDFDGAKRGYQDLANEAQNIEGAKDIHFQARLGFARCALASDQAEAFRVFEELIEKARKKELSDSSVLAGAWNGMAACYFERKEHKNALLAALHVITQHDDVASEMPQAYFCAAACFYALRSENKDWEGRAVELIADLRREYPGSPWTQQPYKNPPSLLPKAK